MNVPPNGAPSAPPDHQTATAQAPARRGWWKPLLDVTVVAAAFLAPFRTRNVAVPAGPGGPPLPDAPPDGLIGGSLWIMSHLDHDMLPMSRIMQMQR